MMPMSKQTWNEGEKYLAIRILFIYVLIFLVYVFPFISLHYYAKHKTPHAVIYEQYKKMVHATAHDAFNASHTDHHKKPHGKATVRCATKSKRS